ncbi:MAG: Rieske 2Fe-2S domain-containing protein [Desulfobacteria bacterium]|nr:ubiquinol-cytochrome c reductase iron-sulfur subunit [Deltaproteobacteria bacterium]MDA8178223.1 ubiquinol-cytochrome c reductase iron-sulfur subunit [Deltaproteobacteria bacterium]
MDEKMSHPDDSAEATRRDFFRIAIGVLGTVVGLVLAIPLVGFLVGPAFRKKIPRWARVAKVESLPLGQPAVLSFTDQSSEGYLRETVVRNVWAVRRSATEVTVFSPICTHLGCRYDWEPNSGRFLCPCHGSLFGLDGKVLAGPAPRPLDTLPVKIENGELFVEWERFELGISRKIPV